MPVSVPVRGCLENTEHGTRMEEGGSPSGRHTEAESGQAPGPRLMVKLSASQSREDRGGGDRPGGREISGDPKGSGFTDHSLSVGGSVRWGSAEDGRG